MTLTSSLIRAGIAATTLDMAAFIVWILPGRAAENNPIVAGIDPLAAILARCAVILLIACIGYIADHVDDRLLTFAARLMGAVAVCVGVLGFGSTLVAVVS